MRPTLTPERAQHTGDLRRSRGSPHHTDIFFGTGDGLTVGFTSLLHHARCSHVWTVTFNVIGAIQRALDECPSWPRIHTTRAVTRRRRRGSRQGGSSCAHLLMHNSAVSLRTHRLLSHQCPVVALMPSGVLLCRPQWRQRWKQREPRNRTELSVRRRMTDRMRTASVINNFAPQRLLVFHRSLSRLAPSPELLRLSLSNRRVRSPHARLRRRRRRPLHRSLKLLLPIRSTTKSPTRRRQWS